MKNTERRKGRREEKEGACGKRIKVEKRVEKGEGERREEGGTHYQ